MNLPQILGTVAIACTAMGLLSRPAFAQDSTSLSTGRNSSIADKRRYLDAIISVLMTKWPANRIVNIVCHGHSVPAGYLATPLVDSFSAYPLILHKMLKERFPYAVLNVIVAAIGGENSESGAERFDAEVLNHNPDVLTIDYGLNDRRIGPDRARAALVSMVQRAKAKGIKVILLTPTPDTAADWEDSHDPINLQANLIRSIAAEYQVGLVDCLAACQGYVRSGGLLADIMAQSNHPNRKGHEIVAHELLSWFAV